MKSRFVDWSEAWHSEEWEFIGADLIYEIAEARQSTHEDVYPEDEREAQMPIYNFAYPLYSSDIDAEKIIEVCRETNCTVLYNTKEECYYLALTGCGMDLTQDIALAYIIIDGCIDWDFLEDVYVDGPLSISERNYQKLLTELDRQLQVSIENKRRRLEKIRSQRKEDQ